MLQVATKKGTEHPNCNCITLVIFCQIFDTIPFATSHRLSVIDNRVLFCFATSKYDHDTTHSFSCFQFKNLFYLYRILMAQRALILLWYYTLPMIRNRGYEVSNSTNNDLIPRRRVYSVAFELCDEGHTSDTPLNSYKNTTPDGTLLYRQIKKRQRLFTDLSVLQ